MESEKREGFSMNPISRMIQKYMDETFDTLDHNSDGTLSFEEVYELMLLVSIQVNRQAPLAPPSKELVKMLFERADVDKSGTLTKEELRTVVLLAMPRTTVRLGAYKILQFLIAPSLAVRTVNKYYGQLYFVELGKKYVPIQFHGVMSKKDFWKLYLSVAYVTVLARYGLPVIVFIYDHLFKILMKPTPEPAKKSN